MWNKICDACGATVENGVCPYCGKVFTEFDNEPPAAPEAEVEFDASDATHVDAEVVSEPYGSGASSGAKAEDGNSILVDALSFLFPPVGLIYWIVKRREKPVRARNALIAAGIGLVLSFFLNMGK